jgi:hypothetical protein
MQDRAETGGLLLEPLPPILLPVPQGEDDARPGRDSLPDPTSVILKVGI